MLRIVGAILVIWGCIGTAISICAENKKRLEMLKQIRSLYENMKYYIAYQRVTIPEALLKLSQQQGFPFTEAFLEIHDSVLHKNGDFADVWKKSMEKALAQTVLKKQDKTLLLRFPTCLGYMEENVQAKALDELIREAQQCIADLEKRKKATAK